MTNRELIKRFYDEVFNNRDISNIDKYMNDDYKQHSAGVKDGKEGFLEFCSKFLPLEPHAEIKQIISEDDLVCVFFKCTMRSNNSVNKVTDIYRIQDGKLAEHWDVVEHDVGCTTSLHSNCLF